MMYVIIYYNDGFRENIYHMIDIMYKENDIEKIEVKQERSV